MLGGCWRDAPGPPRQQEPEPSAGRAGFEETEECWCHLEGITRLKSAEIVTARSVTRFATDVQHWEKNPRKKGSLSLPCKLYIQYEQ